MEILLFIFYCHYLFCNIINNILFHSKLMINFYLNVYEEFTINSLPEIKTFDCHFIYTLNPGVVTLKFTTVSPSIF